MFSIFSVRNGEKRLLGEFLQLSLRLRPWSSNWLGILKLAYGVVVAEVAFKVEHLMKYL